ncbi:hypothetical protein PF010_g17206 [Phytophthora fragariae]|nr:hypothetical protein PF009_g19213 [Phytophthora fragariae]KAE9094179.1 hypothetical protein PF010_g17206 [Phytophthora fragariae]KAE9094670.1 hypothetical protein PF007_g17678 [Phytophthora fragariae]KAE9126150.1 hypothetical protein PF006_g16796 [Phytophthora fragariae]KAE9212465.1 hypothetical protein PF002_g18250 [Phytophthora fragariae]
MLTPDLTTVSQVQRILDAAEAASPVLDTMDESQLFNATFYPDAVFETDWSTHVNSSDIIHQSALHRGCVKHKKSVIPWTFGRIGQSESAELNELVNHSDPKLLEKLRKCPDVDILLPDHLRSYGYCEDAAAYTKFLESRMLPQWVLEVKFDDVERNRSVTYHDLCPNTPMIFFNHYWEGVPDAPDWPVTKPFYLMPNIEMYELESAHYWRADVILCKTALCARYLRKWFRQEGNPRATRVVYTRHTTTNLALTLKSELSTSEAAALAAKNFSDVSFLHTAGKSMQKGTRQVLDCWLSQPEFPPLDFYVDRELYDGAFNDYEERIRDSGNVRLHTGGLSAEAFGRVIAQGRYFLCPSMMEGYGHYINQARSANAFIITTDAAPMNELITPSSGALVRARTGAYGEQFMGGVSSKEHALRNVSGLVAGFEKDDVCNTVVGVLKSSTAENREQRATRALQQYYFDTVFFAHKMKELRAFARAMSHPSLRGKILDNWPTSRAFTQDIPLFIICRRLVDPDRRSVSIKRGADPFAMDIMMRLKGAGFSAIANAFREREKRLGGGLPLLDFVEIVLPGLPRPKTAAAKAASVSALVDLFEDIDINGDGVMEFEEFTSFCVDAGMVATRTQVASLKHRYERDTKRSLKTTAASTPVPNSTSHVPTRTSSSSATTPLSTSIEKLKWSAECRMFLVVENTARSVKVFMSDGKFVTEMRVATDKQTQTNGASVAGNGGVPVNDVLLVGDGVTFVAPTTAAPPSASSVSVLDAVFIHRFQWLAISTTDFAISFYDMSESRFTASTSLRTAKEFALLKNLGLTTTTAQLMLRFCESSALLLGSGNDFIVNVWKVIDAETKVLWRRLSGHADLVLDALEIPQHDLLVSCDLRHSVQLWDISDGRPRGSLVGHERGVRQLCYSTHHDLLLSAGFEFEALAWDLGSRQVALKLSGHRAPLVGVQLALFQTERAITADCLGVFKVWDITRGDSSSSVSCTSHAVQLESVDLGMPSARVATLSFVSMHPSSRDLWVVTSGSCTLQHFRSVRVQQFNEVPLRAFYHYSANKFVVVAVSVCSLWDGETGACSEEFTHVGSISAAGAKPTGATEKKDAIGISSSSSSTTLTAPSDPIAATSRASSNSTHNEPTTELLTCAHDLKCRKLVVVTELGAVGVFNCQNFVQMRQSQESFLSKARIQRRTSAVNKVPVMNSASTCAVVGLHYCSENKLIVLVDAGTSAIVVIDDNSDQESSKGIGVLRRLINIPSGISTSAYSFHASMIATVAADPEGMKVSLWDFETLVFLGNCRYDEDGDKSSFYTTLDKDGHMLSMHVLEFWDEFPILLGADSKGGVYFFAVTPLLHANTGKLLHAFPNDHDSDSKTRRRTRKKSSIPENHSENEEDEGEDSDDDKAGGSSFQSDGAESITNAAEFAARKMLLSTKMFRKNALTAVPMMKQATDSSVKSPMETSAAVTCLKVIFDEESDRYLLFVGDERGCVGIWDPSVMVRRLALAKIPEIKCKYLRRGYQPKSMFYRDYLKDTAAVDSRNLPNQRDKHRPAVSHGASGGDWRRAMLLGDDLEHMNVRASHTDLKKLSKRRQESRIPRASGSSTSSKPTSQQPAKTPSPAHVKDAAVVNAVAAAEFLMNKGSTFSLPTNRSKRGLSLAQANGSNPTDSKSWPGSTCHERFPHDVKLLRRWQAHIDGLTSLELSRHPNIVVTCGLDMRVFVWDWSGSCLGKLFDPENQGPWPWRFRMDNATRTKERDVLVRELLRELERTPVEKMELRRQTLYAEHVGRRNVSELRNVNAMLLEHIISKTPEIKMLEEEIKIKKSLAESSSTASKIAKFRDSRSKTGTLRALALLPTKAKVSTPMIRTPRQSLRLQSLSQVGPLIHGESRGRISVAAASDPPTFLEPGELKMDKAYLENELSITCPTSSTSITANRSRDVDVRQQIHAEYELAQQAAATRATLIRKTREMYSNMEEVRTRHGVRRHPSPDEDGEALEASELLKRNFPASVLAVRPQTAPVRALLSSSSAKHVGRTENALQQLQMSASEPTLPAPETSLPTARKLSTGSAIASAIARRRSSLDEIYMEEFHRHRQQQQQRKDRDLNKSVPEDSAVDSDKHPLRPLHKLREINDIIDKVQGYCDDGTEDNHRYSTRPGTVPIVVRSRFPLLPPSTTAETSTPSECGSDVNTGEAEAEMLRQHIEDTKHRMQEAMRDDKRMPHRQNLRRMRLQAQQKQQRRRMHSYLQQKRREVNTNIGNVFKGLQTAHEVENGHQTTEEDDEEVSTTTKGDRPSPKLRGNAGLGSPKLVSAKKTFGMYTVQEVMSVIRLFWSMDVDGSGNISLDELQRFKSMFDKLGYHNLAAIFQTIDSNGDGQVSLRELLSTCFHYATKEQIDGMLQLAKVGSVRSFLFGLDGAAMGSEKASSPTRNPFANPGGKLLPEHRSELMAIFRVFDHNGDGGVSMQEIMESLRVDDDDVMAAVMTREHKAGGRSSEPVVSSGLTREDVEQIYREFDRDKDATLDFDEFVAVMASLYASKPNQLR